MRTTYKVCSTIIIVTLLFIAIPSVINSFIGHISPDTSVYLLIARSMIETHMRFISMVENKGLVFSAIYYPWVKLLGANLFAAALPQLLGYIISFILIYKIIRIYADKTSAFIIASLWIAMAYSSLIWGAKSRPEDFAVPLYLLTLFVTVKDKPFWRIVSGFIIGVCLFMKISLIIAPLITVVGSIIHKFFFSTYSSLSLNESSSQRIRLFIRDSLYVLIGFTIIAIPVLLWISVFDSITACWQQTVVEQFIRRIGENANKVNISHFPKFFKLLIRTKTLPLTVWSFISLVLIYVINSRFNKAEIQNLKLSFSEESKICNTESIFMRMTFLTGLLIIGEISRIILEGSIWNYQVVPFIPFLLIASSFINIKLWRVNLAEKKWLLPLILSIPFLIPTAKKQWTAFELRAIRKLPAPYELLAKLMKPLYNEGEMIYVESNNYQLVLFLDSPRPYRFLPFKFRSYPLEERQKAIHYYDENPPVWIITTTKRYDRNKYIIYGDVDDAYHVYLNPEYPIDGRIPEKYLPAVPVQRPGNKITSKIGTDRNYQLEIDIGYLKAWRILDE